VCRSELIPRFTSSGGVVKIFTQSERIRQGQGKSSFSKLRRKNRVKTLSTGIIRGGSKTKTFEHLENFPIMGEQRSLGGGATTTIRSDVGRDMDHHIRVQEEGGMREEKKWIPSIGSKCRGFIVVRSR
jgi:hypothetical protein